MENYLIYIGKAAIAAGAFYLAFLVLFQNRKQFVFNRIFLPVSLALSFVIPLITITVIKYIEAPISDTNSFAFLGSANSITETYSESPANWQQYVFGLYLPGVAGFLFHLVAGHVKAIQLIKKSQVKNLSGHLVHVSKKDVHPFSFFNKIVISEKTLNHPNLKIILSHEYIHVQEKHTLDILFAEILFLLQWFNPFAWLIKDALKNNLEYKTDHKIVKTHEPQIYQMAMLTLADKRGIAPFLTALNGSQLKNRIIMMKKKNENKFAIVRQLAILPLLAILIMGLSNRELKPEVGLNKKTTVDSTGIAEFDSTKNEKFEIRKTIVIADSVEESSAIKIRNRDGEKLMYIIDGVEMEKEDLEKLKPESIAKIEVFKNEIAIEKFGENAKDGALIISTKKEIKLNTGENPLILVDEEVFEKPISEIDPESIKEIEVIKGKSTTEKYGDKAKDGVIIITSIKQAEQNKITSVMDLRKFIAKNIKYPAEAQIIKKEGTEKLFVELDNGGAVKEIYYKASGDEKLIDDVVVTGYTIGDDAVIRDSIDINENILRDEVERVLNLLPTLEIPELYGESIEVSVKFVLQ